MVIKQLCDLYFKNILAIVSNDHKWSLYYKCLLALALVLASVVCYNLKWVLSQTKCT
jgi:hypothetical protein